MPTTSPLQAVPLPVATDADNVPYDLTNAVNYIEGRLVMRFSSASTRSSTITSPVEGMMTWLQDTNTLWIYNGTTWVLVARKSFSGVRSANLTRTNATLTADTDMGGFAMDASSRYRLDGHLEVEAGSVPDLKLGLGLPASATFRGMLLAVSGGTDDVVQALRAWTDTGAVGVPTLGGTGGVNMRVTFWGTIVTAGTAGNMDFLWSENTTDAGGTTMKVGSHTLLTYLGPSLVA